MATAIHTREKIRQTRRCSSRISTLRSCSGRRRRLARVVLSSSGSLHQQRVKIIFKTAKTLSALCVPGTKDLLGTQATWSRFSPIVLVQPATDQAEGAVLLARSNLAGDRQAAHKGSSCELRRGRIPADRVCVSSTVVVANSPGSTSGRQLMSASRILALLLADCQASLSQSFAFLGQHALEGYVNSSRGLAARRSPLLLGFT